MCFFLENLSYKKNMMTLQVPYNIPLIFSLQSKPGKSISPFTFGLWRFLAGRAAASLTAEAAMSLPLFLFFAAALLQPMRWLDRQRTVQTAVECMGEELSIARYLTERKEESLLSEAALGLWLKGEAGAWADGVMVERAQNADADGNLCLAVRYKEKLPFLKLSGADITMRAACRRRPWIGLDGKLRAGEGGKGPGEEAGQLVFVGANMGRYHLYRDCHYLSNQYEAVPKALIGQKRNGAGSRYRACTRCSKGGQESGIVYITPEGTHYHFDKDCSAMVSYVRTVLLQEVEHLGVCSYCARRRGEE